MKTFVCEKCQKNFTMPDNVVSIKCDSCDADLTAAPVQPAVVITDPDVLPAGLQEKLDAVESRVNAEQPSRFDRKRGVGMGLLCFGLFFTFGIAFRSGALNAAIFGVIGGVIGFLSGAIQRPVKK